MKKLSIVLVITMLIAALTACAGEPGIQGEQGPQGIQGPQGPEGPRGMSGVAVAVSGYVAFNVTEEGILQCSYTGDEQPNYYINEEGHLVFDM